jgi:hypothetical protein
MYSMILPCLNMQGGQFRYGNDREVREKRRVRGRGGRE